MSSLIRKYLVLICLVISAILIVIAAYDYPGGSVIDKNSLGFHWSKNFISNLYGTKALNGSKNPGWLWALMGMVFHSIGYGVFFINMSKKIPLNLWANILKYLGLANIIFIFLIATPLHDVGVFSIILTLLGLFVISIFIVKSKRHFLKIFCFFCLLTYYIFFIFFGLGIMTWAVILQKVYIISSMLLVIGLEYFTKKEDYTKA